jgi:hypothetical protein
MSCTEEGIQRPIELQVNRKSGCSMITKGWAETVAGAKLKEGDICMIWFYFTGLMMEGVVLRLNNDLP